MLNLPILLLSLPPAVVSPLDAVSAVPQDAATPAAPAEPKWTGAVSLGASLFDGDTDTRNANATADAEYRREKDRFTFNFWWNYQEDKNATPSITQRRTGLKGKYDYFFTKKTYGLAQASAENDFATDVKLRTTIGVGVGHQFLEDESWIGSGTWKVLLEAGVSMFDEDFYNAQDSDYVAARGAYNLDWKPSAKWGLTQTYEIFPSLEDSSDVFMTLDTRGKIALTEKMFAQLQWKWTYDNTPAGTLSRTNDLYALSVGWSF